MSVYSDSTKGFKEGQEGRPDYVTDEHLEYLDDLRESGVTNMFGAGRYLEDEFDIERKTASGILSYWMKTFSDRHPRGSND